MFIDSHCHLHMLDLSPYKGDLSALIKKAKSMGVDRILCVCVNLEHVKTVIEVANDFENVSASIGLHPSEKVQYEPSTHELIELADQSKVVAIGETGLDYYYNKSGLEKMRDRFRRHIQAAKKLKKPLIIHSRNARMDTIQIMKEESVQSIGGVVHCFTESWEMAKQIMKLGFYISFSGIVTFKNTKNIAEVVKKVPLEKILIETDAPYLAPVPHRGKKNEPQYLPQVAMRIAQLKNVSLDAVAKKTTENYYRLFG